MAHTTTFAASAFRRTLATGVAAAALLSGIYCSSAFAEDARIKEMTFSISPAFGVSVIKVASSDGKKWDTILPSDVSFLGHMKVDTRWPGYVEEVGVFLGYCNNSECGNGYPRIFHDTASARDYNRQETITFSTSQLPISSSTGIAVLPYGNQILKQCNDHLQADGATKSHAFSLPMTASFSVNTRTGAIAPAEAGDTSFNGGDQTRQANFSVPVQCEPYIKRAQDVAAEQPATLSVGEIELFRSTYVHATSQPNPGTVCKKARWLVRLNTNKAGPVKFKLWLKNGDAPMTSKVIDAWASFDGNSKYKAEYAEWTEVTKTSVVQGMAEDMTNPIGQSTGWKDITLQCDGVAGGLADAPKPDNGEPHAPPLKVTGELTLADQEGVPKDRPRAGQAVFKIWANKPGATKYRLTCSGGRNWEGTLPTFKVSEYKYQAVGAQNLQIDKTEQIGCALRSLSLPNDDVIAVASRLYEIIKRNPDHDGKDTLVDAPKRPTANPDTARPVALIDPVRPQKPDAQKPDLRKPDVKVAPLPKLSCAGGKVSRGECFCPSTAEKVQAATNAFRCVKQVARPLPTVLKQARPSVAKRPVVQPAPQRQSAAPQRPMRFVR